MIKLLEIASLCAAFFCGFVGMVFGQAPHPPMQEPSIVYTLPAEAGGPAILREGRSAYKMWDPDALYKGSDDDAERTGGPQDETGK